MKRAYPHALFDVNEGKRRALLALFHPFREALGVMASHWRMRLLHGDQPPKYVGLPDNRRVAGLSARQMKSVGNMTRNMILSWQALLEDTVRGLINKSTLTPWEKTVLNRVNVRHAWWAESLELTWTPDGNGELRPTGRKDTLTVTLPVEPELLKLARRLVKHAVKLNPYPDLRRTDTLILDSIVAKPTRPETPNLHVAWWVKISTLNTGHPVNIPLKPNEYFEREYEMTVEQGGGLCGVIQLHRADDDTLLISLVTDTPDAPLRDHGQTIGIDFGMADALFATSSGELLGVSMLRTLRRLDQRLTEQAAWLQRRGIKPTRDPGYRKLQNRIRSMVRNEIGRQLNRLAARDGDSYVRRLVLEKLDFRYGGMSHRMNRLITRTGRACLKQRLQALTEKHGIQVTLVPPQYTSQECSGCGYVNKRNRKDRSHFNCRFCNKKLHADINASRVVKSRSSWQQPDNTGPQSRRNTFRMLDQRFRQRWHLKPTQGTDADVTGAPRVAQTASSNGAGRENGICE